VHQPDLVAGGQVTVLTVGGLARRKLDLFWPLVAEQAGNVPAGFSLRYVLKGAATAKIYLVNLKGAAIMDAMGAGCEKHYHHQDCLLPISFPYEQQPLIWRKQDLILFRGVGQRLQVHVRTV